MKEMIEKIPTLAPLNRIIDKINDLLDQKEGQENADKPIKYWIAGVKALTKMPGQSYDEYKEGVFANEDAIRVKMADLRHNTDIRRLKDVTQKDLDRLAKYNRFFMKLQSRLA